MEFVFTQYHQPFLSRTENKVLKLEADVGLQQAALATALAKIDRMGDQLDLLCKNMGTPVIPAATTKQQKISEPPGSASATLASWGGAEPVTQGPLDDDPFPDSVEAAAVLQPARELPANAAPPIMPGVAAVPALQNQGQQPPAGSGVAPEYQPQYQPPTALPPPPAPLPASSPTNAAPKPVQPQPAQVQQDPRANPLVPQPQAQPTQSTQPQRQSSRGQEPMGSGPPPHPHPYRDHYTVVKPPTRESTSQGGRRTVSSRDRSRDRGEQNMMGSPSASAVAESPRSRAGAPSSNSVKSKGNYRRWLLLADPHNSALPTASPS
eukprot:NODE_2133_length_1131_cov_22.212151_g2115_i0.p1 GENE.NODE_2133_length_1131_cov_22.212151_g2115_i0~~NODE_2133_length_1131_cov_22.212151_g2115_i0.p1  ORF type:complete len:351 (-),score=69.80 NODE_2133_length_1131_cov_22.212151_g2115_i0:79-1044(-)